MGLYKDNIIPFENTNFSCGISNIWTFFKFNAFVQFYRNIC